MKKSSIFNVIVSGALLFIGILLVVSLLTDKDVNKGNTNASNLTEGASYTISGSPIAPNQASGGIGLRSDDIERTSVEILRNKSLLIMAFVGILLVKAIGGFLLFMWKAKKSVESSKKDSFEESAKVLRSLTSELTELKKISSRTDDEEMKKKYADMERRLIDNTEQVLTTYESQIHKHVLNEK